MKVNRNSFRGALRIFIASLVLFSQISAQAAVLGDVSDSWQTDLGGGAVYKHTTYSASVGNQAENYVEYTPNSEAVPIVVNGASVYGKRTITSAAEYMKKNNLRPLIGINADFFSSKTGIPMGYTIIDGEIYSKENNVQDAVGFRADGTAFIDRICINTRLWKNNSAIDVTYLNKWPQDGLPYVYMLTDDYGTSTKSSFNALYVICSKTDGDLSLNSKLSLNVDEVFIYNGEIKIPDNKYVFVMDVDGDKTCFDFLANLAPSDKLDFANSVSGAERHNWEEAEYAASSIGGRLINNGTLGTGFEAGTAPRTAVGIKSDGAVVFYTLDGRQSGYSYGARIETLAKRMQELGCVDAINLDGGGSTAIGAVFPGWDAFKVTNSPSDGAERSCANYLFLKDMRDKTGIVWYVKWKDYENTNYLAGTTMMLEATSVYDTGNYKMDGLAGVEFNAVNTDEAATTVDDNGYIAFKGTGKTTISVKGERYNKSFDFNVYETPDEIKIFDESTDTEIKEITVDEGGMKTINLEAAAYVGTTRLEAAPSLFRWETEGSIASVDEDGNLNIKDNGTGGGKLLVTAGGKTSEFEIRVIEKDTFSDISGHWAHDVIESMADSGIINGFEEDGKKLFKPDSNITRIQFAAIVCKSMGINPDEYSNVTLNFTDTDKIQPWAVNYIKAMVSLGYIGGRSDDDGKTAYFDPESKITRAEAFTVIGRTINTDDTVVLSYSDASDIPVWAQNSVSKLTALGYINGFEDNSIKPNTSTTRAEAAALIYKVIN